MCFENFNQDSISSHHLELDQYQTTDKLASFYFNEIELDYEGDTDLQFCNSVTNFKSVTLVSLPDLDPILEPVGPKALHPSFDDDQLM